MDKRLAFLINTKYCNNCKTCEIACKMDRKLPLGQRWREVRKYMRSDSTTTSEMNGIKHVAINIPMSCNHCERPQCVEVCPMHAYQKLPMGMVVQRREYCIGCTKCVGACPYSAPVFNPKTGHTGKCDMCYDRFNEGKEPFCVQTCPNNAIKVDTYENLVASYGARQDIRMVDGGQFLPLGDITNPSVVIVY